MVCEQPHEDLKRMCVSVKFKPNAFVWQVISEYVDYTEYESALYVKFGQFKLYDKMID